MSSQEIDRYLEDLEEPKRSTLQRVRRTILEVVPQAEEGISYGVPAFRIDGKVVAGLAAFKKHLSYLPHSGSVFPVLREEVAQYRTSTGALQFPVDSPLPKSLVEQLIRVRMAQAFPESETSRGGSTVGSRPGPVHGDPCAAVTPSQPTMRDELLQRVGDLDGVVVAEGAFAPGPGVWVGAREIAHFDGARVLDVRLTRRAIADRRSALRVDGRVTLRRGTSDWVGIRIESPADMDFALSVVEEAVSANRDTAPAGPPPTGSELERRRRFH